jgi:hypothetical protein
MVWSWRRFLVSDFGFSDFGSVLGYCILWVHARLGVIILFLIATDVHSTRTVYVLSVLFPLSYETLIYRDST